jgi:hypothetical protein
MLTWLLVDKIRGLKVGREGGREGGRGRGDDGGAQKTCEEHGGKRQGGGREGGKVKEGGREGGRDRPSPLMFLSASIPVIMTPIVPPIPREGG